MYFIGSGALLSHAVAHALQSGLRVDGVCVSPADAASARLLHQGVTVFECEDPNAHVETIARAPTDAVVFSINNKHVLGDALLRSGPKFFNIHNGWVQRYRGIAEICIFAAVCRGEEDYGVSLQQLLPGDKVDAGPVVAQSRFPIAPSDGFAEVLETSLQACRAIFESQAAPIIAGAYRAERVETAAAALRYPDIAVLAAAASPANLRRATALGRYAGFFPRLREAIVAL